MPITMTVNKFTVKVETFTADQEKYLPETMIPPEATEFGYKGIVHFDKNELSDLSELLWYEPKGTVYIHQQIWRTCTRDSLNKLSKVSSAQRTVHVLTSLQLNIFRWSTVKKWEILPYKRNYTE